MGRPVNHTGRMKCKHTLSITDVEWEAASAIARRLDRSVSWVVGALVINAAILCLGGEDGDGKERWDYESAAGLGLRP